MRSVVNFRKRRVHVEGMTSMWSRKGGDINLHFCTAESEQLFQLEINGIALAYLSNTE